MPARCQLTCAACELSVLLVLSLCSVRLLEPRESGRGTVRATGAADSPFYLGTVLQYVYWKSSGGLHVQTGQVFIGILPTAPV